MARLDAKWLNFAARGASWWHFWQDAPAAAPGGTVTGTLSVTLGALILAATGAVGVSGAASPTLGALTLSAGTATVSVSGTGAATLGALTAAGTGSTPVSGALAETLGSLTLSGTATGGGGSVTVRRYYRGKVAHAGAVQLSRSVYYVDETP